ncbi:hypothetical protein B0H63DRAFT_103669 [Podospora didyma]|uniref:Uncharacterized protein n=1 Tax=Podospora didyma TaxID=330526 RepID=A0AAE0NXX0_9PEZI|nr:hypothetical protein B0H63DRAFT_103669 [Podospora didyma]
MVRILNWRVDLAKHQESTTSVVYSLLFLLSLYMAVFGLESRAADRRRAHKASASQYAAVGSSPLDLAKRAGRICDTAPDVSGGERKWTAEWLGAQKYLELLPQGGGSGCTHQRAVPTWRDSRFRSSPGPVACERGCARFGGLGGQGEWPCNTKNRDLSQTVSTGSHHPKTRSPRQSILARRGPGVSQCSDACGFMTGTCRIWMRRVCTAVDRGDDSDEARDSGGLSPARW